MKNKTYFNQKKIFQEITIKNIIREFNNENNDNITK